MVMGSVCTRNCRFCGVDTGRQGQPLRPTEPEELAAAVVDLGLRFAVITSVDRDDLPDRGAAHFAACVQAIRSRDPGIGVEVLAPDYREGEVELLLAAGPSVFAHNVETVERLQKVRDRRASYRGSLHTLALASAWAAAHGGVPQVKSSILLGLGEREEEVLATMDDLRKAGVSSLVLGQYLRPSPMQLEVAEYVHPDRFAAYAAAARERGFEAVVSAPLARTSYHARASFESADPR
jgi:lipoic acid synthetase